MSSASRPWLYPGTIHAYAHTKISITNIKLFVSSLILLGAQIPEFTDSIEETRNGKHLCYLYKGSSAQRLGMEVAYSLVIPVLSAMPGFPQLLQLGPEVASSQDGVYALCITETTPDPPPGP